MSSSEIVIELYDKPDVFLKVNDVHRTIYAIRRELYKMPTVRFVINNEQHRRFVGELRLLNTDYYVDSKRRAIQLYGAEIVVV